MSMFSQFETDANLEVSGIWIDYGDFRVLLARAGGSNKKYLTYAEGKTKPFRRAIQTGAFPEERSKGLLYDIYANTVILDWQVPDGEDENHTTKWKKGIPTKEGSLIDVTPENIVATFKLLPALFIDLQKSAEEINLFRKEEEENDRKNSLKP